MLLHAIEMLHCLSVGGENLFISFKKIENFKKDFHFFSRSFVFFVLFCFGECILFWLA